MKRYFHSELDDVRNKLILMGEKANEVAQMAIEGFLQSDIETAENALEIDDSIDALEVEIGHDAVRYVTLRGPVSSDLRLIFVAMKASHDFERAADEAHGIAKKTRRIINRDGRIVETAAIAEMSELVFAMQKDAISCFVDEDLELAKEIIQRDKKVDKLNQQNFKAMAAEDANAELSAETRFQTVLISRALERIADHAKNLAEEVIFLLTGEQ
ncbi:phosphate signaling complex protein PhoU [Coraliomargarita akajimensis]|uniref:Phosphate-specific transport system accessory protein PhoU n=1 Tax=Coraliomargarita akajimensis (strain DSM 45221 / IAM 15411 / JCM 23193 / KCTC 12865 / 04OKA010-24) TaxID=583355 RepID=D5EMA8_CORAD|nr:phosphate signaling complex protein PhoU [Coraliomargarita akajimensis]ADE55268.1 phosphate uptake regulator, PhoU [Coraliomargarita akajimensis DSM 45221]